MQIGGSVALVTGANRGLGLAFTRELVRRGAAKVYGAARHPDQVTEPGVTSVALDITDPESVARAAQQCGDVSLLVNNAGVLKYSSRPGILGRRHQRPVLTETEDFRWRPCRGWPRRRRRCTGDLALLMIYPPVS